MGENYPPFEEIDGPKSALLYIFGKFSELFAKGDVVYSAPYYAKALKDAGIISSAKEIRTCDFSAVDRNKLERVYGHLVNSLKQFRPDVAANLEIDCRKVVNKVYPLDA